MSTVLHLRLLVDELPDGLTADAIGTMLAAGMDRSASMGLGHVRYLGGMTTQPAPRPRVSIRSHTYRGTVGFLVRSSRGDSIHVTTRSAAEKIKARLLADEDTRAEDYEA